MDLGLREDYMNLTPKAREVKAKISEWDYISNKKASVQQKRTPTKQKATNWEKVFAKNSSNKGLISKIYKEIIEFNTKQTIQLKNGQRT